MNKPWRYKQSVVGDTREVSRFKIPERSTSTSGLINKTRINPYFVSTSRGTTLNLLPFAVSILWANPSIVVAIIPSSYQMILKLILIYLKLFWICNAGLIYAKYLPNSLKNTLSFFQEKQGRSLSYIMPNLKWQKYSFVNVKLFLTFDMEKLLSSELLLAIFVSVVITHAYSRTQAHTHAPIRERLSLGRPEYF